ncbi:CoA-binding protein [Salinibacterium sp. GXW1014]|uniref:CoA-binding protein n=1 Tax=Salinibacterium sp. GXW1014 TaxID=3377838 RepID=UPI00383B3753
MERASTSHVESAVDALLHPRSIAVLGASDDPRKPGGRVLRNMVKHGFDGMLIPINPRRPEVQGLTAYASMTDVPVVPDLVIVAIPGPAVVPAVESAIAAGARTFVLLSAFAPGAEDERDALARLASADDGVRILGPNSLGTHSARSRLAANFMTAIDDEEFEFADSGVFVITQSGGVGAYLFSEAQTVGFPVGEFISTGSELDLTFGAVLRDVVERHDPTLVFGYVEGSDDRADLVAGLERAKAAGVPVLLLHAGRSPEAQQAASRHSGLPALTPEEWSDAVEPTGARTFHTIEAMLDAGRALVHTRQPRGDRVTIVAASGGAGILMTDAAVDAGLHLAEWDHNERQALGALLPDHAVVENPVDATGALFARLSTLRAVLESCTSHGSTDIVVLTLGNMPHVEDVLFQEIAAVAHESETLVVVVWAGGTPGAVRRLAERGVLAYPDPRRAAMALRQMLAR